MSRPVIPSRIASAGPDTASPVPHDQSRSVGSRRRRSTRTGSTSILRLPSAVQNSSASRNIWCVGAPSRPSGRRTSWVCTTTSAVVHTPGNDVSAIRRSAPPADRIGHLRDRTGRVLACVGVPGLVDVETRRDHAEHHRRERHLDEAHHVPGDLARCPTGAQRRGPELHVGQTSIMSAKLLRAPAAISHSSINARDAVLDLACVSPRHRARIRLLRALCSTSARPSASSTGGT